MLSIVILAAGQGTRMRSRAPKVMHLVAGRSLLEHVYIAASRLRTRRIHVVYGCGGDQVPKAHPNMDVDWVEQERQLGTGHAVMQVIDKIPLNDTVMVLYGDVPLITYETLEQLEEASHESGLSLLTCVLEDPHGYGRILRDERGNVARIVEEKDATDAEREVCEVNTGMLAVRARSLKHWLDNLDTHNSQGEFYLTDIVQMAVAEDVEINSISADSPMEVHGVNTKSQLAEVERYYQLIQAHQLMGQGVTLRDPGRFDMRGDLEVGSDVVIDINVVIEGSVSIGNNVQIGPNCLIRDADIGDDVHVLANSVIDNAVIGARSRIGPFSRIRPHTRLSEGVHVGNFVELKNAEVGEGSKINHLSYVGDAELGRDVNIGAGTITCNYDGANKHKTIIGDDVFVGSGTQLVAPVRVGDGATIGAGTTVTRDVEAGALAISRVEQRAVKGWKRPKKQP
ncbi:MAG: UDP-N-acetylglucosamine diphosphorylase/glucosamine-1-phosphate N-acetyltransferase [Gammaproteobacteria bacterium RIFCSPLOWO2_02_FULL_61_13]|nr:MAG: UDP-N-acetylglucosamine diphosphorylase/glucosamine-1-phosphate N-acetyltransferase [Gammaproteobacteria bacterium RIFCSPLOWO2_02_FULL_61_13]